MCGRMSPWVPQKSKDPGNRVFRSRQNWCPKRSSKSLLYFFLEHFVEAIKFQFIRKYEIHELIRRYAYSYFKVRADQISDSGFYFFQKSQQSHFRGFIFSRNLSNLSIFFRKSQQFCGTFWTPFWTSFWAFSPCKTPKTPRNFFARRVHFFQQSQIRVLFFPEISAISDSGFYFFQKSHQCFKSGFCLGGGYFYLPGSDVVFCKPRRLKRNQKHQP